MDFEAKLFETIEHIISFSFEVPLKGELRKNRYSLIIIFRQEGLYLFILHIFRVKER